jgi:hypothetical protein
MEGVAPGASAGSAGVPQSCSSAASRLAAAVLYVNIVEPRALREQIKTSALSHVLDNQSTLFTVATRRYAPPARKQAQASAFKDILQQRVER